MLRNLPVLVYAHIVCVYKQKTAHQMLVMSVMYTLKLFSLAVLLRPVYA